MKNEQETLLLYLAGELTPEEAARFEKRLAEDEELAAELDDLRRSIALVEESVPPEPDRQYWHSFYARLQPRLEQKSAWQRFTEWLMPSQGLRLATAFGTLAVIFIVAGVLITQTLINSQPVELVQKATVKIKRAEGYLQNVIADHLYRSRLLLQEMINISDGGNNISELLTETRSRGEELLSDNRTYRMAAQRQNDVDLEELLDELEMVLVEIANLDPGEADYTLPTVRKIIQKKNLLIKIEIINTDTGEEKSGKTEVI